MSSRRLALVVIVGAAAACGEVSSSRSVECGAAPIDVLPNGGFDASTPPWIQDPVTPALLCGQPIITPVDAPSAACLGSVNATTQTLTQIVPLPEGASTVTLSGEICIATAETAALDHDVLQFDLLDGGDVIAAIGEQTNQQGAADCQFTPFELTAPVTGDPATATFRIRATLDANLTTSFYLDRLHVTVDCTGE